MSTACASCPALAPCPVCPQDQICQLSVPTSCTECPTNSCVVDTSAVARTGDAPATGSPAVAGGLSGLVAAFLVLAVLYYIYRKRQRRWRKNQQAARLEEKLKAAAEEKFRPGGLLTKRETQAKGSRASRLPLSFLRHNTDDRYCSINVDSSTTAEILAAYELRDEDSVERGKLHPNGVETICGPPGEGRSRGPRGELSEIVLPDRPFRYSTGAATTLSRITEGMEDDEVDEGKRKSKGTRRSTFRWGNGRGRGSECVPRLQQAHEVQHDAIEMTDMPRKKTWSITNVSPFTDDATELSSVHTGQSAGSRRCTREEEADRPDSSIDPFEIGKRWTVMSLEIPTPVHRPQGSPLIILSRDSSNSGKTQHTSARPLISSPLSALTYSPSRPAPKVSAWGVVGMARQKARTSDTSVESSTGDEGLEITDKGKGSRSKDRSYDLLNGHSALEGGPRSKGLKSRDIDKSETDVSNRLSAITTSSVGSLGYLMMSPQIVTPADKGGIQRLQLKQGKAQLVRVNSEKSSESGGKGSVGGSGEIRGRQAQSQSVSLLDFVLEKESYLDKDPFAEREEAATAWLSSSAAATTGEKDGEEAPLYSAIGEGSGLDSPMPSRRTTAARPPSRISNGSFGLPPFASTPTDDIGSFYQNCTSEGSHYHGESGSPLHGSTRSSLRLSSGTITSLSMLDAGALELRANVVNQDTSTEAMRSQAK